MDVLVANAGAGGAIVITGSITSIKGVPGFGVYAATKAALRSFARTWSVDLKGRNIRVNVISPGTVVTPAFKNELGLSDEQIEDFAAQAAAQRHSAGLARLTKSRTGSARADAIAQCIHGSRYAPLPA